MDDLFEDDEEVSEKKKKKNLKKKLLQKRKMQKLLFLIWKKWMKKVPVGVTNSNMVSLDDFEADDAPVLPQDDEYDLQKKELEAKFDELFGPIDDDN